MTAVASVMLRAVAGMLSPKGVRARLSILIYHRVLAHRDDLDTWDVTADEFAAQMAAVAGTFTVLPLGEAVERLGRGALPPRALCITFDDGYRDNIEVALPILQRHGLVATFFVATGYLDGGRMWNDTVVEALRVMPGPSLDLREWGLPDLSLRTVVDRRAAIQKVLPTLKHLAREERAARVEQLAARAALASVAGPMMSDAQIRALRAAGMEVGAHSVTHPILARIPDADAKREIVESVLRLAEILGEPTRLFAYPNGKPGQDYGPQHVRMVREAGYRAAVSTRPGTASSGADVYQLPRFTPWDRTPTRFVLRLVRNMVA